MKKVFTLIAMAVFALCMQANIYIVGSNPFGDWQTNAGMEMNDNGDGTYSVTVELSGTIWFVFADGLTENAGEWDQFNNEFRFGPSTGADQKVTIGQYISTQKQGNGNGAYQLACGMEPSEFTFTFDLENMEFIVEGAVDPDEGFKIFTVAGSAASVFGTTWDPTNSDNDMVQNADGLWTLDKYNCELPEGNLEFKIVANRDWGFAWPADNYQVYIEQPGYYDVHITFDSTNYEVNGIAEIAGELPPARTDDLFILGEVNGNGWAPNVGVQMDTEDKNIYTADVTATGENKDEGDETLYSYFSFTSKLAEAADDWSGIAMNRLGAIEDGYLVSEDMLGMELGLSSFGISNSFKVPSGAYQLTVNLDAQTLVITKADTPEPQETITLKKLWEITDLSFLPTADVRQGFGMGGKFYINNKADQKVVVVDENGLTNTEYPGGANCGISRDEAGNLIVSNAVFPGAWVVDTAAVRVINPETNEMKEYIIPEELGLEGRCDFIGFAKGDLMEDGFLYLAGGNTSGVSVMSIANGEVCTDECFVAPCDGLTPSTSTVINYYKDVNDEHALLYVTRNAAPAKLTGEEALEATAFSLPNKGACNGVFPFIWEGKEYYVYPTLPNYQNGFAIAEANADAPLVEVESTVAANANAFTSNWLNAEVDKDGVTIYQYYPGGNITVYRLAKESGDVQEIVDNNINKVVAGVRYYNIMGQEMKEANGLTIIVTTYTDGSHSAVKVIK
ncbi:MAG: hypothetical protein IJK93_04490 [Muribaculaceae bacterium]|nr:hypothetical protein [Muribaculaceae bacterium]